MTRTLCVLLLAAALPVSADELPDGAHDFDFNFGTWHTHIKRLTKPLSGSQGPTSSPSPAISRRIIPAMAARAGKRCSART